MIIGRSVQLFYTISALRNPIKSSVSKVARDPYLRITVPPNVLDLILLAANCLLDIGYSTTSPRHN